MLTCTDLRKRFGDKVAVDGVSFHVKQGEVFGLLGSNGAGKTTTMKMILKLLQPDKGEVYLAPETSVGYCPETPYTPPFLSGTETLTYYAKIQGIKEVNREVSRVMTLMGLEPSRTKMKNYSKGMAQRLAVAQALLSNPSLLILDEPTSGLDALGRAELLAIVRRMKQSGKTVLFNSHILPDVERVCDRALIMHGGRVLGEWIRCSGDRRSLEEVFVQWMGGDVL